MMDNQGYDIAFKNVGFSYNIGDADKIVVLKDGMVTDIGTPDELIRKEGYFKRMIELQMKKE